LDAMAERNEQVMIDVLMVQNVAVMQVVLVE
jgi:hypothetical protein